MPPVVTGIAAVLLGWALLAILLFGLGHLLALALVRRRAGSLRLSDTLWLGLAALLGGLQIWHLAWPVDRRSVLFFGALGVAGMLAAARDRVLWPGRPGLVSIGVCLLAAPVLVLMANSALDVPVNFDSGMYHFQQIRWSNEYRIVPGLGNLNVQLGLNQSYFLFPAWLNGLPPLGRGHHLANGFLLALLALTSLRSLMAPLGSLRRPGPPEVLSILLLPVALRLVGHYDLHSPTPDFAVTILMLAAFVRYAELALRSDPRSREATAETIVLTVVLTALVTIKLSAAAFAGCVLVHLWARRWRWGRGSRPFAGDRIRLLPTALAVAMLLIPWTARGVLTTGYPLFPSTLGAVPVEWQVPHRQAEYKAFYIRYHARVLEVGQGLGHVLSAGYRKVYEQPDYSPEDAMAFLETAMTPATWLGPWARRVWKDPSLRVPALVFLPGIAVAVAGALARRGSKTGRLWLLFLPLALALVFWFVTAPEPRLAGALFWLPALWSWVIVLAVWGARWPSARFIHLVTLGVATVCALAFLLDPPRWVVPREPSGFRELPEARVRPFTTDSGLTLYEPVEDRRVWNSELPATPHPSPALRLLRPELGLAGGFRHGRP